MLAMDQLVAINVRYWRRQAGLTQPELGRRVGLSAANVSAIEQSAKEGQERRRLDAQALAGFCIALGVPLAALFLPPPDEGDGVRYQFTAGGRHYGMDDLMEYVVMPDTVTSTEVMEAYRERFNAAGRRAARGARWMDLVARWGAGGAVRARRASELRRQAADLAAAAATTGNAAAALGALAATLEAVEDGQ